LEDQFGTKRRIEVKVNCKLDFNGFGFLGGEILSLLLLKRDDLIYSAFFQSWRSLIHRGVKFIKYNGKFE
jgi:hypothetical protein